ncbi:hypothetical protein Tco_0959421 [Tanacetum coccineum]
MLNHKRIYVTPSHTKKIFRNIRRVWTGFSGRDTPLFPTMMVQAQQEQGEGSAMPTNPHHTPTIIQSSISQPQLKQRSRRPRRKDTEVPQPSGPTDNVAHKAIYEKMDNSLVRDTTTASSLESEQDSGNIDKTRSKGRYGDEEMFDTCVLDGDEVLAEPKVTIKDVRLSVDEVNLAQALTTLKSAKVQEKANVGEEPSESITTTPTLTTTAATTITIVSTRPNAKGLVIHKEEQAPTPIVSSQQPSQVKAQDKSKGIMVEEPMKMKKKGQSVLMKNLISSYKLKKKKKKKNGLLEKKLKENKKPTLLHGIMCKQ